MKLYRSTEDRRLAGVCGGLAAELGWSSTRLRIIWIISAFCTGGTSFFIYLALWFLMPKPPLAQPFEPAILQPWKKAA